MTHWVNVLAVVIMVMSGWRIYNASPIFDFEFPAALTLGGWPGGAIQWHFAAMWLLVANGLAYLLFGWPGWLRDRSCRHGAGFPMKLRMPTKLGYKNPKHITSLFVTNTNPGGYWEDEGYNWFGGS